MVKFLEGCSSYHRIYGKLFHKQQLLVLGVDVQMLEDQLGQHGRQQSLFICDLRVELARDLWIKLRPLKKSIKGAR